MTQTIAAVAADEVSIGHTPEAPEADQPRSASHSRLTKTLKALKSPAATSLAPLALIIAAFFVLPIVAMTVLAFTVKNDGAAHFGLGNFAGLLDAHRSAFLNSALVSGVGSLIAAVVGSITSLCIAQIKSKRLDSITAVFSSVFANDGGAPLAFSFIVTLGNSGVIFAALGLEKIGFTLYSWQGLVAMYQSFLIPTMIMVTLPTFRGLRREWVEANTSLGGSPWTYWYRVGIPISLPTLLGGWVLLFGSAYATHACAAVLLGSGGFQLIPLNIASQLSSGTSSGGETAAMALGVSMIVIAIITLFLFSRLQRRNEKWLA